MAAAPIRVRPCPTCSSCGSGGDWLYEGLDDVLFGAPGTWSMRRCSNRECGLLWLDPQPLPEDIGLAYSRYYTHDAASARPNLLRRAFRKVKASYLAARLGYPTPGGGGTAHPLALLGVATPGGLEALAASVMFLPAPASARDLLDIGCGRGDFLVTMRDLGWRARGVETDPEAAAIARSRDLDVYTGDLGAAGHAAESFDAITMAHVIEHVHDPAGLLAECRRILRPGGTLVILTPNGRSWGGRHFGRDWRGLEPPRHIKIFNRSNLGRLLESSGLRPRRVATLAINASASWSASAAIRRARSRGKDMSISRRNALSGIGRQLLERALVRFDPDAGEDLVAVASRPA